MNITISRMSTRCPSAKTDDVMNHSEAGSLVLQRIGKLQETSCHVPTNPFPWRKFPLEFASASSGFVRSRRRACQIGSSRLQHKRMADCCHRAESVGVGHASHARSRSTPAVTVTVQYMSLLSLPPGLSTTTRACRVLGIPDRALARHKRFFRENCPDRRPSAPRHHLHCGSKERSAWYTLARNPDRTQIRDGKGL